MPRFIKRAIQRWIISRRARKPTTLEDAHAKLHKVIGKSYPVIAQHTNTPQSAGVAGREYKKINARKERFALLRAFRAAGIYGNEPRNELARKFRGEEKTFPKWLSHERAQAFERAYKEALHAATGVEAEQIIRIHEREDARREARRKAA